MTVDGILRYLPLKIVFRPCGEDAFLWPDGEWCIREDYIFYHWKTDDYEVVPYDTDRWREIVGDDRSDSVDQNGGS